MQSKYNDKLKKYFSYYKEENKETKKKFDLMVKLVKEKKFERINVELLDDIDLFVDREFSIEENG